MKRRCSDAKDKFYKDYGARGISVCAEWTDKRKGHSNFIKWASENGYHSGLSIDREDNDKGYYPENCRWATAKVQANNRRNNDKLTIGTVTKSVTEWSEVFGFSSDLAIRRYNKGLPIEKIFHMPEISTKKRSVIRLNDMKEYGCILDAAKDINGIPDKISLVCRGIRSHHKGFRFAFKEDLTCQKIS
jgi:hypothetical protein